VRRLRGFLAGYLGLVALSALVAERGSKQAAGLLGTLSSIIERALSPGVPAIPDYATGGTLPDGGTLTGTAAGPNPDAPLGKSSTILPGTRPTAAVGGGTPRPQ
jgi:hypothetical protein